MSWCPTDHIRHFMYESVHAALNNLVWDDRRYDVLDFGSKWFGDPDGGWATFMRTIFKDILGNENLNHILAVYPEFNIESLHQLADNSMDIIIADQVLEHVEHPWLAAEQIHAKLKPSGIAFVATPGLYPIHPSPLDCWRIMPDGYKVLFPATKWSVIKQDMWGDAARVAFEFGENEELLDGGQTYTVEEAMAQPTYKSSNDGKCPIQIWWIGRKL